MKKQITGQDSCYPNRPANLPYSRVKLHYIIHYINRGSWDHIIDEEPADFNERKIESYTCNICNKVCKNNLEKREYPGRSTALCHLATDHGRLLKVCSCKNTIFSYMISMSIAQCEKMRNSLSLKKIPSNQLFSKTLLSWIFCTKNCVRERISVFSILCII